MPKNISLPDLQVSLRNMSDTISHVNEALIEWNSVLRDSNYQAFNYEFSQAGEQAIKLQEDLIELKKKLEYYYMKD